METYVGYNAHVQKGRREGETLITIVRKPSLCIMCNFTVKGKEVTEDERHKHKSWSHDKQPVQVINPAMGYNTR